MEQKYKVGTKVKIKTDLKLHEMYDGIDFVEEMYPYVGKKAVITDYCNGSYVLDVDEGFWCWGEGMLEEVIPVSHSETEEEKIRLCEDFLAYLVDQYAIFKRKSDVTPVYTGGGDQINIKNIVKEYFDLM